MTAPPSPEPTPLSDAEAQRLFELLAGETGDDEAPAADRTDAQP